MDYDKLYNELSQEEKDAAYKLYDSWAVHKRLDKQMELVGKENVGTQLGYRACIVYCNDVLFLNGE